MGRYNIGWAELRRRRFARQVELGIIPPSTELSPRPEEVPAWDSLTPEQRREHELTMAAFAAMIDSVDQNIGRLIAHLKSMGRFENTLFVFLSDNGGCPFQRTREETRAQWLMPWDPESYWTYDEGWAHASNTPFRWYKQNQHEGGISSPFIVHWPAGLKGNGRIVDGPGHLIDVAATFYDVAAAKYPRKFSGTAIAPLRGRSLLPILKGESDGDPREIWQFYRENRALRQGDWKIASVRDVDRWELFHLSEDRSEVNDLSGKYPARRAAMIKRYEALDAEIRGHASPEPAAVDKMR
jgi:arylsulfatase